MENFIFCAVGNFNVETYYVKNSVPVSWLSKSFLFILCRKDFYPKTTIFEIPQSNHFLNFIFAIKGARIFHPESSNMLELTYNLNQNISQKNIQNLTTENTFA